MPRLRLDRANLSGRSVRLGAGSLRFLAGLDPFTPAAAMRKVGDVTGFQLSAAFGVAGIVERGPSDHEPVVVLVGL